MLIRIPLVVTAAAYSVGHSVGGKIYLEGIATGERLTRLAITDVQLNDKDKQAASYDLHLFDADLVGTVTDRQAFNLHADDRVKVKGMIPIVGMSGLGSGGGVISVSPIYKRLTLPTVNAWAVLIARTAATFTTTSALELMITSDSTRD